MVRKPTLRSISTAFAQFTFSCLRTLWELQWPALSRCRCPCNLPNSSLPVGSPVLLAMITPPSPAQGALQPLPTDFPPVLARGRHWGWGRGAQGGLLAAQQLSCGVSLVDICHQVPLPPGRPSFRFRQHQHHPAASCCRSPGTATPLLVLSRLFLHKITSV